jgi:hypothetical protein
MILATLKTEHFEFVAAHMSKSSARAHVVAGFERHLVEYGSSAKQWAEETDLGRYAGKPFAASLEDWYGINTVEIAMGVCLRDGAVV